jgi:adenylylsulfate kinase
MILVLYGPIGSGKSTLARKLAQELKAHLISSERFKRRVYARLLREVRKNLDKDLVVDATFYKRKWRQSLRKLVGGKKLLMIYLHCSLETCLERNKVRENPVPERAIRIVWSEFEEPLEADLRINTQRLSIEQALDKILDKLRSK